VSALGQPERPHALADRDYRVVARIEDDQVTILMTCRVGHRREVAGLRRQHLTGESLTFKTASVRE
jgi:hypothetical protein